MLGGILPPVKSKPAERTVAIMCSIFGSFAAATAYSTIRVIGRRAHSLVSVNYFATLATISSFLIIMIHPDLHFEIPKSSIEWYVGHVLNEPQKNTLTNESTIKDSSSLYWCFRVLTPTTFNGRPAEGKGRQSNESYRKFCVKSPDSPETYLTRPPVYTDGVRADNRAYYLGHYTTAEQSCRKSSDYRISYLDWPAEESTGGAKEDT